VGAAEVFQGPAAAAGRGQAKSHIGKFSGFSNGNGNFNGVAAFNVALIVSGIKRRLERKVIVKAFFLRVVNAARDSKGHKSGTDFLSY
jgi:hypothetical protein